MKLQFAKFKSCKFAFMSGKMNSEAFIVQMGNGAETRSMTAIGTRNARFFFGKTFSVAHSSTNHCEGDPFPPAR